MDKPEELDGALQSKNTNAWSLKDTVQGAFETAASFAAEAASSAKELASKATNSASDAASSAKDFAVQAANTVSDAVGKTVDLVGDLNGDGKFDGEDLKIAIAKGKEVASIVANEAGALAKDVAKSEMVKDTAAGAVVGAALCSVLPVVGTATGAVVGGAAVAAKKLLSK